MSRPDMYHRTTVIEKSFKAGVSSVFNAWANFEKRAAWNSPSDDVEIRYSEADFSEGGKDVSLCLVGEHIVAEVTGLYHEILADRRILFTEVVKSGDVTQGVSLVSVGFETEGAGARMTVTLQTVAVGEAEFLKDVQEGWTAALNRMERLLAA